MKSLDNQKGFSSVLEVSLIILVVAIAAFVGFYVYNNQQSKEETDTSTQQVEKSESATANDVAKAPEINNTADLNKSIETIDKTDPGASNSDVNALNNQTSGF
jgi:Tfp pilus assembly protein PilV